MVDKIVIKMTAAIVWTALVGVGSVILYHWFVWSVMAGAERKLMGWLTWFKRYKPYEFVNDQEFIRNTVENYIKNMVKEHHIMDPNEQMLVMMDEMVTVDDDKQMMSQKLDTANQRIQVLNEQSNHQVQRIASLVDENKELVGIVKTLSDPYYYYSETGSKLHCSDDCRHLNHDFEMVQLSNELVMGMKSTAFCTDCYVDPDFTDMTEYYMVPQGKIHISSDCTTLNGCYNTVYLNPDQFKVMETVKQVCLRCK